MAQRQSTRLLTGGVKVRLLPAALRDECTWEYMAPTSTYEGSIPSGAQSHPRSSSRCLDSSTVERLGEIREVLVRLQLEALQFLWTEAEVVEAPGCDPGH